MLPTAFYFRFQGASTGTKPVVAPDGSALPDGSTFDEIDTGNRYVWDSTSGASGVWRYYGPINELQTLANMLIAQLPPQTAVIVAQLQAEFRALKQTMISGTYVDTQDPSQGQ